jgi:hypothetical protein
MPSIDFNLNVETRNTDIDGQQTVCEKLNSCTLVASDNICHTVSIFVWLEQAIIWKVRVTMNNNIRKENMFRHFIQFHDTWHT